MKQLINFKKLLCMAITFFTILSISVTAEAADVRIFINGKEFIPTDGKGNVVTPFIQEGTTYVPGRAICEAFDITVDYDAKSHTAFFGDKPDKIPDIALRNGNIRVLINKNATIFYTENSSEVAPIVREGTTYFPLRGVSSELGLTVDWDNSNYAVFITGIAGGIQPETVLEESSMKEREIELRLAETYRGFQSPTGIAVDNDGNLYVSNWSGSTVTKVDTNGNHSVFADGMGSPAGLAFDEMGNLYISDYSKDVIYKVTPDGEKNVFAQGFHTPTGISFNQVGELLVTNRGSNEIVKVDASGKVELVADGMRTPVGVIEDLDGNFFVTNYGGGIIKVTADGKTSTISDEFRRPGVGIDISSQNIIFAADNGSSCVRTLAPDGTTKIVVDDIGGCVAVLVHKDTLYVGSWNDGAVYAYSIETK